MGVKTIGRFYFDSTNTQSVSAASTIPLTSSTTSTKCLSNDNGTVSINTPGAYLLLANITYEVSEASDELETQIYRNGSALGGACAIDSAATTGDYISQSISTVITVGTCQTSSIALVAQNEADVRIANLIVVKLA